MTAVSFDLGELVDIVMGQAPPGPACNKDGIGTVFVKAGEFQERFPQVREWTTQPLKMAAPNDTLVCVVGATAGKVNYSAFECAIGRSVASVRPQQARLDPLFLYQFLQTKVEQLRDRSQGAAQGVITREMLQSLRLLVPPLAEQRRIAAILDKADALRTKRREALAQLDRLALSIFQDTMQRAQRERCVQVSKLEEVFWFQEGPGVRKWQFTDSGVKLLNVGNIEKNGVLDLAKTDRHISHVEASGKYRHFLCDAGDLVIASSGVSIQEDGFLATRGAFIESHHLPLCMNTSTIRFKARGESSLEFLRVWLSSLEFRSQITKLVTGSAQLNFGPSHLRELRISLPSKKLQDFITIALRSLQVHRMAYEQAREAADKLFLSLQGRAFAGEL